ncbi:urease accessory protein UreD [Alphaproteobacteria bacterium]|nr:urease accessory protein UreD [Alphaproteobacteria bacterium]
MTREPALSSAPAPFRTRGALEIAFHRKRGADRLSRLSQAAPLRALFPAPGAGEPPIAALTSTSGGVVGGDELRFSLCVEDGAKATFLGQAAEKIYRSADADAVMDVSVSAGCGAWAEYLPQETILFDGARLKRKTCLNIASGGSILAAEMLAFGRSARGEVFTNGLLREAREIRRDGHLIWADTMLLEDDIALLMQERACFNGAAFCASLILASDDSDRHLELARARLDESGAVTLVNGVLLARWLTNDFVAMRKNVAMLWRSLRSAAAGLPAETPRLWAI